MRKIDCSITRWHANRRVARSHLISSSNLVEPTVTRARSLGLAGAMSGSATGPQIKQRNICSPQWPVATSFRYGHVNQRPGAHARVFTPGCSRALRRPSQLLHGRSCEKPASGGNYPHFLDKQGLCFQYTVGRTAAERPKTTPIPSRGFLAK